MPRSGPFFIASAVFLAALPVTAAPPPYETQAPVAYMIDLSSGAELYVKDADKRIAPASMTKMMTLYVAFDIVKRGKARLGDVYTVNPGTWEKWHGPKAGSTMFLRSGERLTLENLLHGISTLSGNDASVVMAEGMFGTEQLFTVRMNELAARLGMEDSHFGTATGWPDGGKTYSTARDLAKLGRATLEHFPEFYKKFDGTGSFTWGKGANGASITQPNRNPILGKIDGADGIKTGHTEEAGYCFTGSAQQKGRRLVMVVAGIESFNGRITESIKFMDWGFKAWQSKPMLAAGKRIGEAELMLAGQPRVGLVTPRPVSVSLPSGSAPKIRLSYAYQGPIKAPFKKGDHIADLVVKVDGLPAQITPLVAEEDVDKAGFFGRAWAGFLSFF